ncbi:phosphate acyltransferase PlsX [Acetobacteroides hydrogenigenes]|uniref:Phosphate acyltransferase n=1 Tax=Acetobacteroides hydrogenigenes TaxID=979970 RepID=A0A4R2ET73_9BACT|nr:phosphate acyltransferase PlsX [Acetobacteroides hydrogenigenes]TCN72253.1 glycerol-3-phosphate acyltransferase PlsX [Acetobacteroides hydrogenigenes]
MKIGVDAMGGDFAPEAVVLGAIEAQKQFSDVRLVLIGDKARIEEVLVREGADIASFDIVHTDQVIEMGEHPVKAFSSKPQSSIAIGFKLLMEDKIQGFASAGSTGGMMVGAMYTIKQIPGLLRPAIASPIPVSLDKKAILLDVGLNPDCKPEVLVQYAMLGSVYAQYVLGIENPRVGLLNIGEEEEKGSILTQATYGQLKDASGINFIGNIEGHDVFHGKADVIVTDGFTGNVLLKTAESFYGLLHKEGIRNEFFEGFNFENIGGTPVLGVNGVVIIGHGISNAKAIKNMIKQAIDCANGGIVEHIRENLQ